MTCSGRNDSRQELEPLIWLGPCSWKGRKDEPPPSLRGPVFPCFRKASVTLREASDRKHFGNPFRERVVCRVHADEMIESGFYIEVPRG